MSKKTITEKKRVTVEKPTFKKPFLIGLFIASIILVPLAVTGTLILPLNDWFSLSTPIRPGSWTILGALTGFLLSAIFAFFFARSISPSGKVN
ncbi:MAG: hypothetical protein QF682_05715 [Candidatus Thermoplasmatota archaeon]|nr:hypothetical protein [Candidatus Thermoplasmatota archaeon]